MRVSDGTGMCVSSRAGWYAARLVGTTVGESCVKCGYAREADGDGNRVSLLAPECNVQ